MSYWASKFPDVTDTDLDKAGASREERTVFGIEQAVANLHEWRRNRQKYGLRVREMVAAIDYLDAYARTLKGGREVQPNVVTADAVGRLMSRLGGWRAARERKQLDISSLNVALSYLEDFAELLDPTPPPFEPEAEGRYTKPETQSPLGRLWQLEASIMQYPYWGAALTAMDSERKRLREILRAFPQAGDDEVGCPDCGTLAGECDGPETYCCPVCNLEWS